MSKSVYSIVLNDAVVEAVDEMAYRLGTNRSNMINQILAEKVAYVTPEQHIRNILDRVEGIINNQEVFRIMATSGDSSLMIKSSFKYKYNPSVKYSVVLNKNGGSASGELRVAFRTQNSILLQELNNFLDIWNALEAKYNQRDIRYARSNGRYVRILNLPGDDYDENQIGEMISEYITGFDRIMKLYFAGESIENIEMEYAEFYKKCLFKI
ncbi:MAG: hypothetical protein Q4D26_03810 [Clostridia bacterium]|nr:hypothetical protein [Clostridia bacterium]